MLKDSLSMGILDKSNRVQCAAGSTAVECSKYSKGTGESLFGDQAREVM